MSGDWAVESLRTDRGHQHTNAQAQAAAAGPLLFLSAVRGTRPGTAELDPDVLTQARQCFANLADLLDAVGSGLDRVVRIGMFLKDLQGDRPRVNQVWREVYGDAGPARFAVEVTDLGAAGDGSRLLLDVIAVRSGAGGRESG